MKVLSYSGRTARLQYHLLMWLYRLAWSKWAYGYYARGLGQIFPKSNAVDIANGGSRYRIWLNDAYWTRFVLFHHNYEPEIDAVIRAAQGSTDIFCDLGANKGYWTTFAAGKFGHVVAVEASTETFSFLAKNAKTLQNIDVLQAAIYRNSGETLTFLNVHNSHASARLDQTADPSLSETVQTVRIDDLAPAGKAALIKLDVEGAEIPAFEGATRTIKDGSVFIYEDHGNDLNCETSAWFLSQSDMQVFQIDGAIQPLTSVSEIAALKTDAYKGYNFMAAHKSSGLLKKIVSKLSNI